MTKRPGVRVILSDLHFGDETSTLNDGVVAGALKRYLDSLGTIEELVLAGDILEANLGSLRVAIEGMRGRIGFRKWLAGILSGPFRPRRIVYVPGNHDYIIWNLLSTDRAFMEPVASGQKLGKGPLRSALFEKPFISGVAPEAYRSKPAKPAYGTNFVVQYPDYRYLLDGRKVVVTHGHYFDWTQSFSVNLEKMIEKEGSEARAVRKFFILSAQYQSLANTVSYMPWSKKFVMGLYGGFTHVMDVKGLIRDMPIDGDMIDIMELYLKHYDRPVSPDVLIFGHTHRAARARSDDYGRDAGERYVAKPFEIYNIGSFMRPESKKRQGTFLVTGDGTGIKRLAVTARGEILEL